MLISGVNRMSQFSTCLAPAHNFLLSPEEAHDIIAQQVTVMETHWDTLRDEATLGETERALFWLQQFLNPFAFEAYRE